MKTLILILGIMLIPILVYTQDIAGEWSGSLQIQGTALKVIFHVHKLNGDYTATLDSPDQNVTGVQVTTTTMNFPDIKFEVAAVGGIFEGVLADNRIVGKWVQSGTAFFLVLIKK